MKHNNRWYTGYGGGDISKNQEIIGNQTIGSVVGEVSGFRVSEIILQPYDTFLMCNSNILICSKKTKEWN